MHRHATRFALSLSRPGWTRWSSICASAFAVVRGAVYRAQACRLWRRRWRWSSLSACCTTRCGTTIRWPLADLWPRFVVSRALALLLGVALRARALRDAWFVVSCHRSWRACGTCHRCFRIEFAFTASLTLFCVVRGRSRAPASDSKSSDNDSAFGLLPHQLRYSHASRLLLTAFLALLHVVFGGCCSGFLRKFETLSVVGEAFDKCTACSPVVRARASCATLPVLLGSECLVLLVAGLRRAALWAC